MIVFNNTRIARPWKRSVDIASYESVRDCAAAYPRGVAPDGVCLVTAGVDTQDNRLAVHIVGWGEGLRAWTVDYVELLGDPQDDDVWRQLTELISRGVDRADGGRMDIAATAMDMAGHRGEAVKNFARQRLIPCPIVIRGASRIDAPPLGKGSMQDVTWRGKLDKRGVMLHLVGTIEIKNVIFSRIIRDSHKDPADRMLNFSKDFDENFFAGIISETYNKIKRRYEKKPGARNEPLDTLVYAYAALHHPSLRAHLMTATDWGRMDVKNKTTKHLDNQTIAVDNRAMTTKPKPAAQRASTAREALRDRTSGRRSRYV